jgi:hypothetical protein
LALEIKPSSSAQNSPEHRSLPDILVSFFSGALFVLFLSKLRTPMNKTTDSPHSHGSTDQRTENPDNDSLRRVRITETNGPPAPAQYNYPNQKPKRWWKRWKPYVFVVNLATFVAVTCYGCLTNGLLKESREANKKASNITELTKLNFRKQNRPFVGIVDKVVFVSSTNSKWTVRANVKNYGATPARRVVAIAHMLKTREGWHGDESCRVGMEKSNKWSTVDANAIFPADKLSMDIETDPLIAVTSPPQPYLSICVSYQDLEIGFKFKGDNGKEICSTYNTQTLYSITPRKEGPEFQLIGTSVETAQPTLETNESCHDT